MRDPVLLRNRFDGFRPPTCEAHDLDALDVLDAIQVLLAERALTDHHDFHEFPV
jgi:hypothetical protein